MKSRPEGLDEDRAGEDLGAPQSDDVAGVGEPKRVGRQATEGARVLAGRGGIQAINGGVSEPRQVEIREPLIPDVLAVIGVAEKPEFDRGLFVGGQGEPTAGVGQVDGLVMQKR